MIVDGESAAVGDFALSRKHNREAQRAGMSPFLHLAEA